MPSNHARDPSALKILQKSTPFSANFQLDRAESTRCVMLSRIAASMGKTRPLLPGCARSRNKSALLFLVESVRTGGPCKVGKRKNGLFSSKKTLAARGRISCKKWSVPWPQMILLLQ